MCSTYAEQFQDLCSDLQLVLSRGGEVREINRACDELLGCPPDELVGRPMADLVAPEDRPSLERFLASIAPGEEMGKLDLRLKSKTGSFRWFSLRARFGRRDQAFFLLGRDVHEQVEREAFSKLFFESAPVGLNLCKLDGTWVESNPAFLRMIGYSHEEADGGLTYWRLTPRKYDEMERAQLDRLRKEGKYGPYEKEFIRKDGELVPVRLNGFVIIKDGEPYIWSIIEDTSQERRLMEELQAKTALSEAIVENVPSILFLKDIRHDFRFTLWNKTAEEVLQLPKADVVGKTAHEIWPKEHADLYLADDINVVRQGHLVDTPEEPAPTRDRGTIFLHTKKVPLRIADETEPSLLLCISEDITERKRLEAALRAAIGVRDEFLSVASHELKTPFTALHLHLQLLCRLLGERTEAVGDPLLALARKSLEASRLMSQLLNELLDVARIRTGRLALNRQSVDLREVIQESVSMMSEEFARSGAAIRVRADGPILGWWDRGRLHQVIANLLSNALKYGEKKPVEVTARLDAAASRAELTVRDRGMGVQPELREAIFQRFERGVSGERVSGLGLGLYITRQIVEAHGGSIRVESAPGEGSLFLVELPAGVDKNATEESS